jgi:hypothetical protein
METTELNTNETAVSKEKILNNKNERAKRAVEMKQRALENIDSIFVLPWGTEGYCMVRMVRTADKLMSLIRRKFGSTIDLKQAKKVFKEYEDFAGSLWEFIYTIAPNLHNAKPEHWRKVNDTIEVKKLIANRRSSVVIEPRSEESARIAMAVKIIQMKNVEMRNTANFDELEKYVNKFNEILADFDKLLEKTAKSIKQEYKSPLNEIKKKHEKTEAVI